MFDTFPPPDQALNEEVAAGWPVLLVPAPPPQSTDPCSTRRRDVLVAMRDGTWEQAVVWAWTWNAVGRPVQWRCQVEIGGHIGWYVHDDMLIRVVNCNRRYHYR